MECHSSLPMTRLSVNINKIALLRNSRNIGIPSRQVPMISSIKADTVILTLDGNFQSLDGQPERHFGGKKVAARCTKRPK